MAAAADELLLLERVFLRIGSADTDEQLQNAVSKFLPPVLLKLSSQQDGVRKKVMELLVHINKRIKTRPLVQLPVEALLLQYQDPSASSFVTNFTIIYIKLGYPRLPISKQADLVPSMLNALEAKPQSHQDSLLMLIIPLLGDVAVPADPQKRRSLFGLNEKPHVAKQLSALMLDMLLLPYGSTSQPPVEPGTSASAEVSFPVPPGMSQYTYKRVTNENPLKPEALEKIKLGIVKFLAAGVFNDADILLHLIVAAADTRFSVANLADLELKKIIGGLDWGSTALASQMYRLYLGTQTGPGGQQVKPENKKSPASTRIRLKLLHYLCKVVGAGFMIPACVQVVFDSLYGTNTNTRLKSLALNFTKNIIQNSDIKDFTPIGSLLLCGMIKLTDEGEAAHQGQAYVIIGMIGRRLPSLVCIDLNLLENLFKKLVSATPDLKLQIREGMLNLVPAYKYSVFGEKSNLNNSKMVSLYSLLSQYLDDEEPMVRFVAVRFISTVFPPEHVKSKYLLLIATGDSQDEVTNEAIKSLYGTTKKDVIVEKESDENKLTYPPFQEMMQCILSEVNQKMQKPQKCFSIGNHTIPFPVNIYKEMVNYLRICLVQNAGPNFTREAIKHPSDSTPILKDYLEKVYSQSVNTDKNVLVQYLLFIKRLLKANVAVKPLCWLVEIIGCIPKLHTFLIDDLPWIKDLLHSTKEEIREQACVLYGIIIAHSLTEENFDQCITELLNSTKNDKYLELQHGSLLAAANAIERRIFVSKMEKEKILNWVVYKSTLLKTFDFLKHNTPLMMSAACVSIGLLGHAAMLPIQDTGNDSETQISIANGEISKLDVVQKLFSLLTNNKLTSKIRERAARSLGLICVGEIFPHINNVLEGLVHTSKDTKDVEIHFTIGESLVMAINSVRSPEARDAWSVLPENHVSPHTAEECKSDDFLMWVLHELLDKTVPIPHPNSRQAVSIWLLSIVKHCSHLPCFKNRLSDLQSAFMDLLSENNDIVVDVASKGLGLVFESCESDLGDILLNQLVGQLQTGRKTVPQVTGETRLFEEGELGKSPTGGNLSTYKELCSLASDLNKPDLIYQFMQIANHNTIWNSKKGAAFGFLTIASKAGEQLKPHLPKIIPRLYRYQFDPTPSIQTSMQRIWHSLVTETQKTIDEYQQEILKDLIANLTANQWRVRHSCCMALQDFLRSGGNRSLHDMIADLNELWIQLFRVMDDVHEGTRVAATNTAKLLSKLCIRASDSEYGKNGGKMVEAILPVLLQNGITNTVAEVRAISLQTVSQLVGVAGNLLKPFLPLLIPALLQATGELENSKLSYLSTMLGGQTQTQDAVDTVRASAAKSHYTTETMSRCIQYIDVTTLQHLIPKVLDLIKTTSPLGTRIACAHFTVLLSVQMGTDLQPYAGKLLAALVHGLTDRNMAVRKHYACAIGHLVKCAKDSSLEKLFQKIKTWYFEKEDNGVRSVCAILVHSIATSNQDVLKRFSDVMLPFVFFAMHAVVDEETRDTVNLWTEIWNENSPGTELAIQQNIVGVCDMLRETLESPAWIMKAQAANAVCTVANKIGSTMDPKHRNQLLQILVTGLNGRTWNGKENLLKALSSICVNCKDAIRADEDMEIEMIIDVVMKECKKENIIYRRYALQALGDILSALEVDRFEELYNVVQVILAKDTVDVGSDEEDLTAAETSKKREDLILLRETVYETLGKAWPKKCDTQEKYGELFVDHCVTCLPTTTRSVQVSVLIALCQYVDKLAILNQDTVSQNYINIFPKILENILKALKYALTITKHTRLRKEALNVIISLAKKLKDKKCDKEYEALNQMFEDLLPSLESDNQPEIRSRVIDIKEIFNIK